MSAGRCMRPRPCCAVGETVCRRPGLACMHLWLSCGRGLGHAVRAACPPGTAERCLWGACGLQRVGVRTVSARGRFFLVLFGGRGGEMTEISHVLCASCRSGAVRTRGCSAETGLAENARWVGCN